MAPMHEPLSAAGFAWVSIKYRLTPSFRFPAAVEDVETAIRWLRAHAAEYHIDPRRIALSGESATGSRLVRPFSAHFGDLWTRANCSDVPKYRVLNILPSGRLDREIWRQPMCLTSYNSSNSPLPCETCLFAAGEIGTGSRLCVRVSDNPSFARDWLIKV